MSHEEISFCELKSKDIVNEVDGRKLGKVSDLVFSPRTGCVLGIVAPYNRRGFFFKGQEIYIPFKNIIKIGPDVVLVKLTPDLSNSGGCVNLGAEKKQERRFDTHDGGHDKRGGHDGFAHSEGRHEGFAGGHDGHAHYECRPPKPNCAPPPAGGDCDFKCEKCMLFDCARRWKGAEGSGDGRFYQ